MPPSLLRDLERYAVEADRGADGVRPGVLDYYGRAIAAGAGNEDVAFPLGDYLAAKLANLASDHTALMAGYHAEVAARRDALKSVPVTDDATAERVAEAAAAMAAAVEAETFAGLRASRHFGQLLGAMSQSMRERLAQIDMRQESAVRAVLIERNELEKRQALSIIARFAVRLGQWASRRRPTLGGAGGVAGVLGLIEAASPGSIFPTIKFILQSLGLV